MKFVVAIVTHKNIRECDVLCCSPGGENSRPKGTIERRIRVKNYGAARTMADEIERK